MTSRALSSRVLPLVAGLCIASSSMAEPKRYDGIAAVTVHTRSVNEVRVALAIADGLLGCEPRPGETAIYLPLERVPQLAEAGLEFTIDHENIQALIDAERPRALDRNAGFFEDYRSYTEIVGYYNQLALDFPDLVSVTEIGPSIEGRQLIAATITAPGSQPGKPTLFFNGGQHAREWISPAATTWIADQFIRGYGSDPFITDLLDRAVVKIVPVVNPDGYEFSRNSERLWRKNRRINNATTTGVDLNRNWDIMWGGPGSSGDSSSDIYRGTAPFSEPETQHIRDLVLADPTIVAAVDIHSFSQLILYPWGFTADPLPEPDNSYFIGISNEMSDVIQEVSGAYYDPRKGIDLYITTGTAKDWYYGGAGAKGWTFELRPATNGAGGFVLPAEQIVPVGEENLQAFLRMAQSLTTPIRFRPSEPVPAEADAGAPVQFAAEVLDVLQTVVPGSARLVYRTDIGATEIVAPVSDLGSGTILATLPALSCGRSIEWRLEAEASGGETVAFPPSGMFTTVYRTEVVHFADDFESDQGWTVGAPGDTATAGFWERADPQRTNAQPADDASPNGSLCYITGAAAGGGVGANDVDDGATTLTSPIINAADPGWLTSTTTLSYARWYSNDRGNNPRTDTFPIEISTDGGQTWAALESIDTNDGQWMRTAFEVPASDQFRVRFVAQDQEPGSVVEAGVDDVAVRTTGCQFAPADISSPGSPGVPDGQLTGADFLYFLELFSQGDLAADLDANGVLSGVDFFGFLSLFQQG